MTSRTNVILSAAAGVIAGFALAFFYTAAGTFPNPQPSQDPQPRGFSIGSPNVHRADGWRNIAYKDIGFSMDVPAEWLLNISFSTQPVSGEVGTSYIWLSTTGFGVRLTTLPFEKGTLEEAAATSPWDWDFDVSKQETFGTVTAIPGTLIENFPSDNEITRDGYLLRTASGKLVIAQLNEDEHASEVDTARFKADVASALSTISIE